MKPVTHVLLALTAVACTTALAQAPAVLRDLDAARRVTLSKEELGQLLPGASMSRVSAKGNTHFWTNDSDGTFVISSEPLAKLPRCELLRRSIRSPGAIFVASEAGPAERLT